MNPYATVLAPELPWMWSGVVAYAVATAAAACDGRGAGVFATGRVRMQVIVLSLLGLALALLAFGIAVRWQRIGHGPFVSLFEILASSLVTLGLIYAPVYGYLRSLRGTAVIVLPWLLVMGVWLVVTSAADTHLPPTFDTPVLWFHVTFGKLFLGCALVASGIAAVVLLRGHPRGAQWFRRMPGSAVLDVLAWKFMLGAVVFQSFMLIAGAVWAQDAWGRYWAWDPLETWSFATWLALSAALHARLTFRVTRTASAVLILVVFALAFLTFFGVPFVSAAPHKGAL